MTSGAKGLTDNLRRVDDLGRALALGSQPNDSPRTSREVPFKSRRGGTR